MFTDNYNIYNQRLLGLFMKKLSVEIVVPAYNEAAHLSKNISLIRKVLTDSKLNWTWNILIAENGSLDNTYDEAKKLEKKYKEITAVHFHRGSKDNAVIESWIKSKADILMFTDADNSAHPKHIPILINAILKGNDIAIGSRYENNADTNRGIYRDTLSKIYNKILLPLILPTGVNDTQCGFKAIRKEAAMKIIPKMSRENGFFDSELLSVAYRKKFSIKPVPITWEETRQSVLSVNKNIPNFLVNIFKTRFKMMRGYYD